MCKCGSYDGSCGCKKSNFGDDNTPWYKTKTTIVVIIIVVVVAYFVWK